MPSENKIEKWYYGDHKTGDKNCHGCYTPNCEKDDPYPRICKCGGLLHCEDESYDDCNAVCVCCDSCDEGSEVF